MLLTLLSEYMFNELQIYNVNALIRVETVRMNLRFVKFARWIRNYTVLNYEQLHFEYSHLNGTINEHLMSSRRRQCGQLLILCAPPSFSGNLGI